MDPLQRVFITGASSGLGEGLARHYAVRGAVLGLVARRAEKLKTLADDLQSCGAQAHIYPQDVSDTAAMSQIAAHFFSAAGGIDLVIANAGVGLKFSVQEETADQVVRLMNTNVNGVINTLLPFIPAMVARGSGVLVGMSSTAAFRALPWRSAYCASKAAVKVYMDGIRMELRGTGVHAMSICPGFVDTPLTTDTPQRVFLVDVPVAVRKIARAIERRRNTCVFPWQLRILRHVWPRIPERWLVKMIPPPTDVTVRRSTPRD